MGVMAGPYQRMLAALLPPGKLWRLIGESFLASLLLACADELDRLDARAGDLLREANPGTAVELLPEYERELDLDAAATTAERQARAFAKANARPRYRPVDFQETLALLLGLDAGDVVVLERTAAVATSMGDVREKFRFFVYRNPALPGTYYVDAAQEQLDATKKSIAAGHVIESIDFLCDDEFSLCDRDLLGA